MRRRTAYRKDLGGVWAMGFGLLGLLVTIAIIVYLVGLQTDSMVNSTGGRGPKAIIDEQKARIETFSQRNVAVGNAAAEEANKMFPQRTPAPAPGPESVAPSPSPAPSPAPVVAAPAPAVPSGGTPIGPISPVTPLAPIHAGPGPNLRSTTQPIDKVNKGLDERAKELEKALNGG